MKASIGLIVLLLVAAAIFAGCVQEPPKTMPKTTPPKYTTGEENENPPALGYVLFSLKDKAISREEVQKVVLAVTGIKIHSPDTNWVNVTVTPFEVDLLENLGTEYAFSYIPLQPGTYTQIRMDINAVKVDMNGQTLEAKLPSGTLKFVGNIVVEADKNSSVTFDFEVDKSLHSTGQGKIIFAPVIKLTARKDANFSYDENGAVLSNEGTITEDSEHGMDERGEFGKDKGISSEKELEIDDEGNIVEKKPKEKKEVNLEAIRWAWKPDSIEVNKGDLVTISVTAKDSGAGEGYDFYLPAYKIKLTVKPGTTQTVEFDANQSGRFQYSSLLARTAGHGTMVGYLEVKEV